MLDAACADIKRSLKEELTQDLNIEIGTSPGESQSRRDRTRKLTRNSSETEMIEEVRYRLYQYCSDVHEAICDIRRDMVRQIGQCQWREQWRGDFRGLIEHLVARMGMGREEFHIVMKHDLHNQPSRKEWQNSWSQIMISDEKEFEANPREHTQEVIKELRAARTRVATGLEVIAEETNPRSSEDKGGKMNPPTARARLEHTTGVETEGGAKTRSGHDTQVRAAESKEERTVRESQTSVPQRGGKPEGDERIAKRTLTKTRQSVSRVGEKRDGEDSQISTDHRESTLGGKMIPKRTRGQAGSKTQRVTETRSTTQALEKGKSSVDVSADFFLTVTDKGSALTDSDNHYEFSVAIEAGDQTISTGGKVGREATIGQLIEQVWKVMRRAGVTGEGSRLRYRTGRDIMPENMFLKGLNLGTGMHLDLVREDTARNIHSISHRLSEELSKERMSIADTQTEVNHQGNSQLTESMRRWVEEEPTGRLRIEGSQVSGEVAAEQGSDNERGGMYLNEQWILTYVRQHRRETPLLPPCHMWRTGGTSPRQNSK
jgi:hypothetical protein